MNSNHGYWQAKFILGANFAHQATESYRRWQLSLARKENPWRSLCTADRQSLLAWQYGSLWSLGYGGSLVWLGVAVCWLKARYVAYRRVEDGQAT